MTATDFLRSTPLSARLTAGLLPVLAFAVMCLWNGSAAADFRLCNNTSSRVGIALGYKDAEGWTTEGWWNVSSRSCETLLRGTLVARFYYIYALDYDRGGEWSGQAFMCSRDKEFTIKGTENCLARGFDRTGFFEVDTGEQRAWTVQLTEANEQPGQRVPGIPGTVGPGEPGGVPGLAPGGRRRADRDCRQPRRQAMRRLRRIKIVATLGPASSDSAMIRKLFEAGADVFRINMSHTPHDKMRELVTTIRNVESSYGRPIGILVDLQGPKLRLGAFAEGSTQLNNGESFVLDSDKTPGDNSRVQLPHPEILAALRPGHALLLDDGKVRLIAEETSPDRAVTRVVIGGRMSDRKGVSLPDTDLPVSAMTPKDRADLEAALDHRHRLDRALLRAACRGRRRGQADHPRPRRCHGQDREAAGDRPARRDHRGLRRADGGARRSRRRNAAGAGARPAEADDPDGAPRRQAGGGRDADAGIDDPGAGADPRRSLRRRDRRL